MTTLLRIVAVAVTCAAIVDPVWRVQWPALLPVGIRTDGTVEGIARAARVRAALAADLEGVADLSDARHPAAVVFVGGRIDAAPWPAGVPVSIVAAAPAGPNLRIVGIEEPAPLIVGQVATIEVELEANGLAGQTSRVALEQNGVTLAAVTHQWATAQERQTARLEYAPVLAGASRVTVRSDVLAVERRSDDDSAAFDVVVRDRKLRVLVYEPRPSWNATFIRRVLEEDDRFTVSSLSRVSPAVSVRDASGPAALADRSDALHDHDVILVGAPEDLREPEVETLARFARVRGGAVVLLADRRPSGPYTALTKAPGFSEVLLETPSTLANDMAPQLRASELIVPEALPRGSAALATIANRGAAPVASVTPLGDGVVVFWGAPDAWRFRADPGSAFARFWRTLIAGLANQAPAALTVTLARATVRPHERFAIRAQVRATELRQEGGRTVTPDVAARVVSGEGAVEDVRLWPTAERGVFIGRAAAGAAGKYDVQVTAGGRSADTVLTVAEEAPGWREDDLESLRMVAGASGGVVVTETDLGALAAHLRGIGTPLVQHAVRPMQSAWWFAVLAACLCAEWALRRKRGLA